MGEQRKQLITVDQFRELARPTSTHLDEDEVNAYILLPLHPGIKLGYLVNGC